MSVTSQALNALHDSAALERLVFSTPWSARAFGLTLAAVEGGAFTRQEFQAALIEAISHYEQEHGCIDSDDSYYSCWIVALTSLLKGKSLLEAASIESREVQIRQRVQDIHDHDHDHDHDDDHVHDHDHDHDHQHAIGFPV